MRASLLGLVAVVALAAAPAARAEEIGFPSRTLDDLMQVCSGGKVPADRAASLNFCHGYAQGVLSLTLHEAGAAKPFCLGEHPPSRTATMNEFVTWARAKDNRASTPAIEGLEAFFKERFPCPK
jgi:hypothetical protein